MTAQGRFVILCGLLAAATAVVFFAIAIDHAVYAPGAGGVHAGHALAHVRRHVPVRLRHDVNVDFLLRKVYSIVAFAIVGFLAAPTFPRKARLVACTLLVAIFSTVIEIAQKLTGTSESLLSNLFDVGCGALGGLIGGALWNLAEAIARRRRRAA
jgi:hypothetical protein